MIIEQLTELECAYLAGLIDGDGGFYIYEIPTTSKKGTKVINFQSYIKYCSCYEPVIKWVCDKTGCCSIRQQKPAKDRQFEKIVYYTQITGDSLTQLTKRLLPYLIIKKQHAEIMLKFRSTYQEGRHISRHDDHEAICAYRRQCMIDLRQTNSRFHAHLVKSIKNTTDKSNPCALSPYYAANFIT